MNHKAFETIARDRKSLAQFATTVLKYTDKQINYVAEYIPDRNRNIDYLSPEALRYYRKISHYTSIVSNCGGINNRINAYAEEKIKGAQIDDKAFWAQVWIDVTESIIDFKKRMGDDYKKEDIKYLLDIQKLFHTPVFVFEPKH